MSTTLHLVYLFSKKKKKKQYCNDKTNLILGGTWREKLALAWNPINHNKRTPSIKSRKTCI